MMMRRQFLGACGGVLASACGARGAGEPPENASGARGPGSPSAQEPASVREVMEAELARDQFPGAVWLIARGNDVSVDTLGVTAVGGQTPMARDTIFRIASMTKAVTAVAVLMLVEDGKLSLDAPVDRWLPELSNRRVLARLDGPLDQTTPAIRPITVRDLLTFTLGFGILFDPTPPIQKAIDELQLVNGAPVPMTPHAPDEWMRRLGALPLMFQPGERWMYNTGSLLQGVLVRRAAQQDFDVFVRERILAPLEMRDTDFHVPPSKIERLAGCGYLTDPGAGTKVQMDRDGAQSAYASAPVFPSGAAGLVSTVDDYLALARMLAGGGEYRGRRLLGAASVRAMTQDQLTPAQRAASASSFFPGFFDTNGWGYGVGVSTAPDAVSSVPGRYGWDGGFGTTWFNDPGQGLIAIAMTQSSDFLFSGARERFGRSVFASVG